MENLSIFTEVFISILKAVFFADFISGCGHWLEDRYGKVDNSWIGQNISKPNLEHHKMPRMFLESSYWSRNNIMIVACGCLLLLAFAIDKMSLTLIFTLILLANINEVHAFAHQTKSKTPKWIDVFQKVGILQSKKHHNLHHASPHEVRYCILTNFLNPILDKIYFFRSLEWIVFKIFKIIPN
jgi:ubiquitin-conjugating enzyme E2 variant